MSGYETKVSTVAFQWVRMTHCLCLHRHHESINDMYTCSRLLQSLPHQHPHTYNIACKCLTRWLASTFRIYWHLDYWRAPFLYITSYSWPSIVRHSVDSQIVSDYLTDCILRHSDHILKCSKSHSLIPQLCKLVHASFCPQRVLEYRGPTAVESDYAVSR